MPGTAQTRMDRGCPLCPRCPLQKKWLAQLCTARCLRFGNCITLFACRGLRLQLEKKGTPRAKTSHGGTVETREKKEIIGGRLAAFRFAQWARQWTG
jgi:hypothetical protein